MHAILADDRNKIMPGKPFCSKLNPYLSEIRTLRHARKTWQEIVNILVAAHGIKTNASSVYEFAKRRAKRPAPFGFEGPPEAGQLTGDISLASEQSPGNTLQGFGGDAVPCTVTSRQERENVFSIFAEDLKELAEFPRNSIVAKPIK